MTRTLTIILLSLSVLSGSVSAQWPCPISEPGCDVNLARHRQAQARQRAAEEQRQQHCRRYVNQCTHTDYPADNYTCQRYLRMCMGSEY